MVSAVALRQEIETVLDPKSGHVLRIPYYHVCVGIVEADDVISVESISSLQQNT